MKKTMTRNIVIMAIVTVIMAVVLSLYIKNTGTVPAADNTASLADGTYTASEQGCLSEVAVTVTVTGGKVTNVAIDASGETPELGGAAAETLADELTKAGSTAGVDAVSGATLTSNAVFTAMDSCLAQAGTGSAGAEDLTDGTYTSSAKGCLSDVEVTVTVSGGKVSEVREPIVRTAILAPKDYVGTIMELCQSRRGTLLGHILTGEASSLRVAVEQDVAALVRDDTRGVSVRLAELPGEAFPARVLRAVPAATERLPSAALGDFAGGRLPVDPADTDHLRTPAPVFVIDLALEGPTLERAGGRAWVRFDHGWQPLAVQWGRQLKQLFLRHFNPSA